MMYRVTVFWRHPGTKQERTCSGLEVARNHKQARFKAIQRQTDYVRENIIGIAVDPADIMTSAHIYPHYYGSLFELAMDDLIHKEG